MPDVPRADPSPASSGRSAPASRSSRDWQCRFDGTKPREVRHSRELDLENRCITPVVADDAVAVELLDEADDSLERHRALSPRDAVTRVEEVHRQAHGFVCAPVRCRSPRPSASLGRRPEDPPDARAGAAAFPPRRHREHAVSSDARGDHVWSANGLHDRCECGRGLARTSGRTSRATSTPASPRRGRPAGHERGRAARRVGRRRSRRRCVQHIDGTGPRADKDEGHADLIERGDKTALHARELAPRPLHARGRGADARSRPPRSPTPDSLVACPEAERHRHDAQARDW